MKSGVRSLRLIGSVLLGLGVVVAAVELGAAEVPLAKASMEVGRYYGEGEIPEYPNSLEHPMGDGLAINGLPMRMSFFSTTDRPEVVRDYYVRELRNLGFTAQARRFGNGYNVSAMGAGGVSYIVVAIMDKGNAVDVFPSIFPLDVAPSDVSSLDALIPYSSDATGVMRMSAKGESAGDVVSYQEPTLPAAEIAGNIRDSLGRKGWALDGMTSSGSDGATVIAARHEGLQARFTIRKFESLPVGASVVAQISRGAE